MIRGLGEPRRAALADGTGKIVPPHGKVAAQTGANPAATDSRTRVSSDMKAPSIPAPVDVAGWVAIAERQPPLAADEVGPLLLASAATPMGERIKKLAERIAPLVTDPRQWLKDAQPVLAHARGRKDFKTALAEKGELGSKLAAILESAEDVDLLWAINVLQGLLVAGTPSKPAAIEVELFLPTVPYAYGLYDSGWVLDDSADARAIGARMEREGEVQKFVVSKQPHDTTRSYTVNATDRDGDRARFTVHFGADKLQR